jgi:hypothetical protein
MAMYFMAAASCQPPYLSALPRHSFRDKKNGGFDFKSHRSPNGHDYRLLYDGFFSFAVVRQIHVFLLFI